VEVGLHWYQKMLLKHDTSIVFLLSVSQQCCVVECEFKTRTPHYRPASIQSPVALARFWVNMLTPNPQALPRPRPANVKQDMSLHQWDSSMCGIPDLAKVSILAFTHQIFVDI
jgi:hypothetical protein